MLSTTYRYFAICGTTLYHQRHLLIETNNCGLLPSSGHSGTKVTAPSITE